MRVRRRSALRAARARARDNQSSSTGTTIVTTMETYIRLSIRQRLLGSSWGARAHVQQRLRDSNGEAGLKAHGTGTDKAMVRPPKGYRNNKRVGGWGNEQTQGDLPSRRAARLSERAGPAGRGGEQSMPAEPACGASLWPIPARPSIYMNPPVHGWGNGAKATGVAGGTCSARRARRGRSWDVSPREGSAPRWEVR